MVEKNAHWNENVELLIVVVVANRFICANHNYMPLGIWIKIVLAQCIKHFIALDHIQKWKIEKKCLLQFKAFVNTKMHLPFKRNKKRENIITKWHFNYNYFLHIHCIYTRSICLPLFFILNFCFVPTNAVASNQYYCF